VNIWSPRLYLSLRLILRLSLSLIFRKNGGKNPCYLFKRLFERSLTEAETKYKAETTAED